MPICVKCSQQFPNWVTVDGVKHNVSRRRQCLICAPLGQRSERSDSQRGNKTCQTCGREYYYERRNRGGHTPTLCNSCKCNVGRSSKKEKAVAYSGGKCCLCGYSRCIQALVFHHTQDDKEFTISGRYSCSWDTLKLELDKCVLLCSNCHQEVHYGLAVVP